MSQVTNHFGTVLTAGAPSRLSQEWQPTYWLIAGLNSTFFMSYCHPQSLQSVWCDPGS
jgi:hypothetical protein